MMLFLLVLYYLFASSIGLILIKQFFNSIPDGIKWSFELFLDYRIITGAVLYISSFLGWFVILSKNNLTYIYPIIVGLGYIFIVTFSLVFLKEKPNMYGYIGIFVILVGVLMIIIKGK